MAAPRLAVVVVRTIRRLKVGLTRDGGHVVPVDTGCMTVTLARVTPGVELITLMVRENGGKSHDKLCPA